MSYSVCTQLINQLINDLITVLSHLTQSDARSSIKSPKLSKKFSLRHMRSITSMGSAECLPEYPGPSGMEKSPTSPGFKRRSKHKSEPTSIKTISRVQSRFFDPIPQPFVNTLHLL